VTFDVPGEDPTRLQRQAIDRFQDTDFVFADHEHVRLAHDVDERKHDVQTGRQHPGLNADLVPHRNDTACRQRPAEVAALHNADLLTADDYQHPAGDDQKEKKENDGGYDNECDNHGSNPFAQLPARRETFKRCTLLLHLWYTTA